MDINTQNQGAGMWTCPKCGKPNSLQDQFCKECGTPSVNNNSGIDYVDASSSGGKSKAGKIILISAIVVAVLAIAGGGVYYYFNVLQKKQVKAYIETESTAFSKSVGLVNSLSTEGAIVDKDDNGELYLKKLDEEKTKAEQAQSDMKNSEQRLSDANVKKAAASLNELLKKFYGGMSVNLAVYDEYYTYGAENAKIENSLTSEMDKLDAVFKNAKTDADIVNAFKAQQKIVDDGITDLKNVKILSGLEDAHKKGVEFVDRYNQILKDLIASIEQKNISKYETAMDDLFTYMTDAKAMKEIEQLEEYYFTGLHNKFVDSRKDADSIKSEFTRMSVEYGAVVNDASIEGW